MKTNLVGLAPKMKKVVLKKRKTQEMRADTKRQDTQVSQNTPKSDERRAGSAMEVKMD